MMLGTAIMKIEDIECYINTYVHSSKNLLSSFFDTNWIEFIYTSYFIGLILIITYFLINKDVFKNTNVVLLSFLFLFFLAISPLVFYVIVGLLYFAVIIILPVIPIAIIFTGLRKILYNNGSCA